MNQILTTEKIYVTPQLKRKKKFFRLEFIISVLLLCALSAAYIYAEYDKSKSEEVGKMMLTSATELQAQTLSKANNATKLSKEEYNVWTFVLEQTDNKEEITEAIIPGEPVEIKEKTLIERETYYDSNDEPYTIIAILNIPKIDKEFAILSRTTDELLKINPTRFEGYEKGPEPNEVRQSMHCRP